MKTPGLPGPSEILTFESDEDWLVEARRRGFVTSAADVTYVDSAFEALASYFAERPWIADAACGSTDGDAWFPEPGDSTHYARKICAGCPVRDLCAADALDRWEPWGIWCDLSVTERENIRGQRELDQIGAAA